MKRKYFQKVMILTMISSLLAGCGSSETSIEAVSEEAAVTESQQETTEQSKETVTTEQESQNRYMGQGKIGDKWIAGSVAGALTADYDVRLQDDFFAAATKDYISNLKVKDGEVGAGVTYECDEIMEERTLQMLQDESLEGHEAELAKNFYELAMDWDARNGVGVEPVRQELERIEQISSLDDVTAYLLDIDRPYGSANLCELGVYASVLNPGMNTVEIDSTPLCLQDSAEYAERTENGENIAALFEGKVKYMLARCGYDDQRIEEIIQENYDFETQVAAHIYTAEDSYAEDFYDKIWNDYSFEQLKAEEGNFPLTDLMTAYGYNQSKTFILCEPDWLKAMGETVYTEENVSKIKSYIIANKAISFMYWLDREAYDENTRLSNIYYGIVGEHTEEQNGLYATDAYLSGVLDNLYVQEYCSEEDKLQVTDMIKDFIQTYRTLIEEEDWLTDETKQMALKKLDTMKFRSCYPDVLKEYDELTFPSKADGGSLLEACYDISEYERKEELKKINQPVNPDEWDVSIREVNAYYNPTDNSINILAGILVGQYSMDTPFEQRLAAVGATIIGHEISHSFDTSGAQFDETGKYNNWWSDEDYDAFTKRADALAAYYDEIIPFEGAENVNGDMVETEAIADMGGLKASLMIANQTPNFDYQEFFQQFAFSWADIYSEEYQKIALHSDVHPLEYLRVNTVVCQFQEFYDTFDVKEGDGMYLAPENRIAVW